MDTAGALLPLAVAMLLTGAVGGLLAGLLGVGGGIVIVPVLDAALQVYGVDPAIRMHVAVATSLAVIIPTSISSTRSASPRPGPSGTGSCCSDTSGSDRVTRPPTTRPHRRKRG